MVPFKTIEWIKNQLAQHVWDHLHNEHVPLTANQTIHIADNSEISIVEDGDNPITVWFYINVGSLAYYRFGFFISLHKDIGILRRIERLADDKSGWEEFWKFKLPMDDSIPNPFH